jgi:hypothetical protein
MLVQLHVGSSEGASVEVGEVVDEMEGTLAGELVAHAEYDVASLAVVHLEQNDDVCRSPDVDPLSHQIGHPVLNGRRP